MGRAIDELGIKSAVLAGHSMGGRVVAQLAAQRPELAIAVLLIDAIVGDEWDLMVNAFRVNPFLLSVLGGALTLDTVTTVPFLRDPEQAVKLGRLAVPTMVGHALQPWRLLGPAVSMLRSHGSKRILDSLAKHGTPTFVIHGDRDIAVPFCTARSAARRSHGQLVRVRNGAHSWLLKDRLGAAIRQSITAAGARSVEQLEDIFYVDDAPILQLTPELAFTRLDETHRRPSYTWTIS